MSSNSCTALVGRRQAPSAWRALDDAGNAYCATDAARRPGSWSSRGDALPAATASSSFSVPSRPPSSRWRCAFCNGAGAVGSASTSLVGAPVVFESAPGCPAACSRRAIGSAASRQHLAQRARRTSPGRWPPGYFECGLALVLRRLGEPANSTRSGAAVCKRSVPASSMPAATSLAVRRGQQMARSAPPPSLRRPRSSGRRAPACPARRPGTGPGSRRSGAVSIARRSDSRASVVALRAVARDVVDIDAPSSPGRRCVLQGRQQEARPTPASARPGPRRRWPGLALRAGARDSRPRGRRAGAGRAGPCGRRAAGACRRRARLAAGRAAAAGCPAAGCRPRASAAAAATTGRRPSGRRGPGRAAVRSSVWPLGEDAVGVDAHAAVDVVGAVAQGRSSRRRWRSSTHRPCMPLERRRPRLHRPRGTASTTSLPPRSTSWFVASMRTVRFGWPRSATSSLTSAVVQSCAATCGVPLPSACRGRRCARCGRARGRGRGGSAAPRNGR